jgi:hypothetical protein
MKRKASGTAKRERRPPVKIPLSFEKAVEGIMGLSPEDAKDVRESVKKPAKKK